MSLDRHYVGNDHEECPIRLAKLLLCDDSVV